MADPQGPGKRSRTTTTHSTRWGRRTAVGPWIGAAVVAPLALAGIATGVHHHAIEKTLAAKSAAALAAHGVNGVDVSFKGRDATLQAPAGVDGAAAKKIVGDVDGVRVAKLAGGSASSAGAGSGSTASASDTPSDMTASSSPSPTPAPATSAGGSAGGTGSGAGGAAGGAAGDTSGCASAAQDVAAALAGHKLEFAESSPQLTAASLATVANVADVLKHCTTSTVRVAGYTDNQGSSATSLPLSKARAKAVKQALVHDGIAGHSIKAKGYGEADPIASNSTAAGRAQNRRVEITVS